MNNLDIKNGEFFDHVTDLVKADIIQMLMLRDRVQESDLFRLCDEVGREISQQRNFTAA